MRVLFPQTGELTIYKPPMAPNSKYPPAARINLNSLDIGSLQVRLYGGGGADRAVGEEFLEDFLETVEKAAKDYRKENGRWPLAMDVMGRDQDEQNILPDSTDGTWHVELRDFAFIGFVEHQEAIDARRVAEQESLARIKGLLAKNPDLLTRRSGQARMNSLGTAMPTTGRPASAGFRSLNLKEAPGLTPATPAGKPEKKGKEE